MTDSEVVREGKGEKNPKGVKKLWKLFTYKHWKKPKNF